VLRVIEIGCGYGSSIFPILAQCSNVQADVCDFSSDAIDILKTNAAYNDSRCNAYVCDITKDNLNVESASADVVLLIFTLSAIIPASFDVVVQKIYDALRPGGVICFRDYGLYDLAMVRNSKRLSDSLYCRNDGTLAYFFSKEKLASLFCQFEVLENRYCTVHLRNRRSGVSMDRVWLQARFRKPASSHATS